MTAGSPQTQTTQNPIDALKQACEAWLQAVLNFLGNQPYLPGYSDFDVTFNPDGSVASTQTTSNTIDPAQVFVKYHEKLAGLPEFDAAINLVANTPALTSVLFPITAISGITVQAPPDLGQQRRMLELYFGVFLKEYLPAHQDLTLNVADYDLIFQKFEEYINGTVPITTTTLIPIRNLRCETPKVSLGRNVYLRHATYEERKQVIRSHVNDFPPRLDSPETMLCVEYHMAPKESLSADQQQEIYAIANAVVFALRLMKPEQVEQEAIYWDRSDQPFRRSMGWASSLIHKDNFSDLYILKASEEADLTTLWKKANKAYNKPELLIARSRYEGAYLRRTLEDMLIDYWVGLEALFLPPEQAHEMAQGIALAVSYYLEPTAAKRTTIYNVVISSHVLRGKVIHGRAQTVGTKLTEMTNKTGELLRRSLLKLIQE